MKPVELTIETTQTSATIATVAIMIAESNQEGIPAVFLLFFEIFIFPMSGSTFVFLFFIWFNDRLIYYTMLEL
jgi:fructose-specific phosphotransferase system IIC component